MIEIRRDYGEGGAGVSTKSAHHERIALVLRGLVDDIASAGAQPATIASADATDLGTAITLVNEIKAALNAVAASTQSVTKAAN